MKLPTVYGQRSDQFNIQAAFSPLPKSTQFKEKKHCGKENTYISNYKQDLERAFCYYVLLSSRLLERKPLKV